MDLKPTSQRSFIRPSLLTKTASFVQAPILTPSGTHYNASLEKSSRAGVLLRVWSDPYPPGAKSAVLGAFGPGRDLGCRSLSGLPVLLPGRSS